MEQLSELEKRVLDVIQKNKELQQSNSALKAEKASLQDQCKQLETSLMKSSQDTNELKTEKASVKTTISDLLNAINSLEASK